MNQFNHELLAMRFAESGYTYRKLGKDISVSRGTLHNVMKGTHMPSYPVACRISEALILSQEDILAIYFPNAKPKKELTT